VIRVVKLRNIRWTGHLTRVRKIETLCEILSEEVKEEKYLKDLRVDGKLILGRKVGIIL
jgi:hypothetical protein